MPLPGYATPGTPGTSLRSGPVTMLPLLQTLDTKWGRSTVSTTKRGRSHGRENTSLRNPSPQIPSLATKAISPPAKLPTPPPPTPPTHYTFFNMEPIQDTRSSWPDHSRVLKTSESFTEEDLNIAGAVDETISSSQAIQEPASGYELPKWYVPVMHRSTSAGIRPLDFSKRYAAW
eukprot:3102371-Rhodomonas_salina.2